MEKMGGNPKKEKNEKELGLVVSQQTVIRNQAKTQRGKNEKTSIRDFFGWKKVEKNLEKIGNIQKKRKKTKKN